jgi:glutaredoxin
MSSKLLKNETWAIVSMSKRDADAVIKLADAEDISLPKTITTLDKNGNITIKGGATVDMGRKIADLYHGATDDMPFAIDDCKPVNLPFVYTSPIAINEEKSREIGNVLTQYIRFKNKSDSSHSTRSYFLGLKNWHLFRWFVAYPLSVVGAIAIVGMIAGWTTQKPGGIEPQYYPLSGNEAQPFSQSLTDAPAATPPQRIVAGSQPQPILHPVKSLEVIAGAASRPNHRLFVFSDPLCPYCKRLEPTLQSLSSRGYEIHIFPTPIHEQSIPMIAGIACAKDKVAAWSAAIDKEQTANGDCDDAKTASDDALAFFRQFGFNATPTLVNDAGFTHVGGFASESEMIAFIEKTN